MNRPFHQCFQQTNKLVTDYDRKDQRVTTSETSNMLSTGINQAVASNQLSSSKIRQVDL